MNLKESKKVQDVILRAYVSGYITITEASKHITEVQKSVFEYAFAKGIIAGGLISQIVFLFLR